VLFVTGSLDRSSDTDLIKALEKYAGSTPAPSRVVDMSNVRWLAPTGAKALIQAGQDAQEKGGSLRILSSRHVLQTLNLLGAKSWLSIESCLTPNAKPGTVPVPEAAPEPAAPPSPAAADASQSAGDVMAAPVPKPQASAVLAAVPSPGSMSSSSMNAIRASASALAGPAEELTNGGHLLRILQANRRYSFHFAGGEMILGVVRERVGGSWIVVETTGTRKILNLDVVHYCEIL
jgi:anti-anti-sigma regulatory factor